MKFRALVFTWPIMSGPVPLYSQPSASSWVCVGVKKIEAMPPLTWWTESAFNWRLCTFIVRVKEEGVWHGGVRARSMGL